MRSERTPETLEEGAKEVSHKWVVATPSKKKEAMSVIIGSLGEEMVFRPARSRGRPNLHSPIRKSLGQRRNPMDMNPIPASVHLSDLG
jgi:hypothetical protein